MSSPALFPIPLDDIVASGNVWWWDTPPTSMAEYDDNENNRTEYVSGDGLWQYAFCWFVDYNELLHRHVELVNPATDEVHTFAYAAIARRWASRWVSRWSVSLSHMGTPWLGGACDVDTRGWVEISTAIREYVTLPDHTESYVDTPTFSAKRVSRIPNFFNYTLDVEAGVVSFPNTREANPLRDIVGESYVRRPTQTLVSTSMVTEQHGLGGGRGFSYTQGTVPPRGVVMDAVCVDADGQAAEIPCLLSTESDIQSEWRTTGDVVLEEDADIGDLDCAHVPEFYLIPSYTTNTVTGDIIPVPFEQAFIRHHGEASTAALDVMSEGEYRTNATHVAIPLQLLRADSYIAIIGLASLVPAITPSGDADTDAVYIRTLVDYHRDRDGVSLVSPLVRRYIQRFGYLDDNMKPSTDPNLIKMGSYIYPCNYVCQDEGDPSKSWFSVRPFRVAQYIGDIDYLRGQSSWVREGANTDLAASIDSDDGRRRHMYITDDLGDGFGFAVCSLDFPLDYNDDYFGKVMWFKRSKTGYGSTTLVTVAAPILNVDTALGQEYKYTFDIAANVWLPCCYGLTIGGQRWYMVNVGYTRDSSGMVVACDNIRWFTLGDSGNADITIQYRDLADGSVRTTVEQS